MRLGVGNSGSGGFGEGRGGGLGSTPYSGPVRWDYIPEADPNSPLEGGANIQFDQNFLKDCIKLRKFWAVGEGDALQFGQNFLKDCKKFRKFWAVGRRAPRSATAFCIYR